MVQYLAVFDSESQRGIYIPNPAEVKETWTYDVESNAWKRMQDKTLDWAAAAAYDSRTDRTIVYDDSGKTWAFDDNTDTWSDLKSTNTPSSRFLPKMAYDSESDKTILFGGINPANTNSDFAETWAFDYTANAWTKMNPTTKPEGMDSQSMAYDSESDRVIMWGGWPNPQRVVWAYDYNSDSWEKYPYSDGPVPGYHSVMAYDPDVDRIFIYLYDQFFAYDYNNKQWEKPTGALLPQNRWQAAMIYSPTTQRLVLFGGTADKMDNNGTAYVASISLIINPVLVKDDIWLYDPKKSEWSQAANYAQP